jgi:type 1 glutamine amidotransferase
MARHISLVVPLLALAGVAIVAAPNREEPPADAAGKIAEALPEKAPAKPAKPRKLLVFSVTNGFRHASIPTGKLLFSELGRKTGAFEAVVSDDLANFEPDAIRGFDAVCFLSTTQDVFVPHPEAMKSMGEAEKRQAVERGERLRKSLLDYVEGGGGFVGIHAATDTFYNFAEYGRMIGGYFDGHPWNAGTDVSIKVEPGQEKHPLVEMFGGRNVEFKEEIYQLRDPYDSKKVHMLLRLDTERTNMRLPGVKRTDGDFGVAWAKRHGKGRVFYCSLGHNDHIYWHPTVVGHYLAGIQWAMGDLKAEVRH